MPSTEMIVIRHGETEWNLLGRWQGHENSLLTENGHIQAKAMAKALKQFTVSVVYSSDLGRALQTAHYVEETLGHPILTDHRLRERHLGIFQGLTTLQMKAEYPDIFEKFQNAGPEFVVPGGESIQQRYDRSVDYFKQLVARHPGETIAVITHGGVLDGLFRFVTGLALEIPRHFKIWNCSLNIFSYSAGQWRLMTFGDISHLRLIKTRDDIG
jgi:probable phosphoglycerate mutase